MRSTLEIPFSTDRFWPRNSDLATDALMLDLEDSAASYQKQAVRDALGQILAQPSLFGGGRSSSG